MSHDPDNSSFPLKESRNNVSKYDNDELVILGSGGGRFMATTQQRSTGGVIFRFNVNQKPIQIHIDPGPGAIRDIRDYQINPRLTNYIFLTHAHTDHNMSIPIIVESLQENLGFKNKKGSLILPKAFFEHSSLDKYYLNLLHRVVEVGIKESLLLEAGMRITGTKAVHSDIPNEGYILEISHDASFNPDTTYRIAFTSDTASFNTYVETYRGVDILVANLLRPNHNTCLGHLCTDEFIPLLKEIAPKLCILIHFGTHMHAKVAEQVRKIQSALSNKTIVIGGEDGLVIPLGKTVEKQIGFTLDHFIK